MNNLKKLAIILGILCIVLFSLNNIYATNLSVIPIDIYSENTTNDTQLTLDELTVGIIVADIVVSAGVVFFYLATNT